MKKRFILVLSLLILLLPVVSIGEKVDESKLGMVFGMGTYKNRDLIWRIVDEDDQGYTVTPVRIFMTKRYNKEDENISWSKSEIRSYLNSPDGFVKDIKLDKRAYDMILKTRLRTISLMGKDNFKGQWDYRLDEIDLAIEELKKSNYEETEDYIYLMTFEDVKKLEAKFRDEKNPSYLAYPTADVLLGKSKGASEARELYKEKGEISRYEYWLRERYPNSGRTYVVRGNVEPKSSEAKLNRVISNITMSNESVGLRPMMRLDKKSFDLQMELANKHYEAEKKREKEKKEKEIEDKLTRSLGKLQDKDMDIVKLSLNQKEYSLPSYNIYGNNYFKLRDLLNILNSTDKKFNVEFKDGSLNIVEGNYQAQGGEGDLKDPKSKGKLLSLGLSHKDSHKKVYAYNVANNNYIKLRDLMEILDIGVDYNPDKKIIELNTSRTY